MSLSFLLPPLTHSLKLLKLSELPFLSAVYCSCGDAINCGDEDHPDGDWGVKDDKCLASCGGVGGSSSYADACEIHGKIEAGKSYDTDYCCKNVPCS